MESYLEKAKEIEKEIINDYRFLHAHAETGFDLKQTVFYVKKRLDEMGIPFSDCGKSGVTALIGNKNANGCVLLRADMDALPIKEESGLTFASLNGNMHACGHDAHTAMLLGAAKLLKHEEGRFSGCVKLLFQAAEEILEGARDAIENGVLEEPKVEGAFMLHCIVGSPLATGTAVVSSGGVSAPGADYFRITVQGRGTHGAAPENGRDPLAVLARILLSLEELKAKEIGSSERAAVTVGTLHAGNAANVIPDSAFMEGSLRAFSNATREYMKKRIKTIVSGITGAFETVGEVEFYRGTPPLFNDPELSEKVHGVLKGVLPRVCNSEEVKVNSEEVQRSQSSAGSEDFAYIAEKVPSVMLALAAGSAKDGFIYPLHHPKMRIDESALPVGIAALCTLAEKLAK